MKPVLKAGTDDAADELLSAFQETRFDNVIQVTHEQLSYIEEVTETYNLQNVWGLWLDDTFATNLDRARREASEL
ncbi:hypothetical protein N7495_009967 [Penicillium taxi]|uniref:uncharacterized protein n=1 Tax=Penicillium taxi TaxID=168475 RepID=UPI0025454F37|nr:uncharacterized protein N7495_009967 [Penicillium taxi]KAJ5885457.1 hypothetical protein N7495_009967 [Penicillium taxi]